VNKSFLCPEWPSFACGPERWFLRGLVLLDKHRRQRHVILTVPEEGATSGQGLAAAFQPACLPRRVGAEYVASVHSAARA